MSSKCFHNSEQKVSYFIRWENLNLEQTIHLKCCQVCFSGSWWMWETGVWVETTLQCGDESWFCSFSVLVYISFAAIFISQSLNPCSTVHHSHRLHKITVVEPAPRESIKLNIIFFLIFLASNFLHAENWYRNIRWHKLCVATCETIMLVPLEMLEHVLDIYVNTTSYMALFSDSFLCWLRQ